MPANTPPTVMDAEAAWSVAYSEWLADKSRSRDQLNTFAAGYFAAIAQGYANTEATIRADERQKAMETAVALVKPVGKRPCDCTRCYCGKPEDAQAVEAWDTQTNLADAIRRAFEEKETR